MATAFQAEYERSIPFTRSNKIKHLSGGLLNMLSAGGRPGGPSMEVITQNYPQ